MIVTGGARGMGASHARGFVAEGANVAIADMLEQEGRALAGELGDRAKFFRLDVTSDAGWAATVAAAEKAFGPVSVLVNNAGIVHVATIAETEPADWDRVIDINLTGTYLGIRAVAPSMRKAAGGAIVNISSVVGMNGAAGMGAYVASKWGVRGLTKAAAMELATAATSSPSWTCCPTFISTARQRTTSSGTAVLNWVNGISSELSNQGTRSRCQGSNRSSPRSPATGPPEIVPSGW